VSPDGRTIAFVVSRPDLLTNKTESAVWIASATGDSVPRRFSSGASREARPRWSPDGARLAFVSHPKDKGASLCVASLADNAVSVLLDWAEDIEELVWTPDGTTLVFTARARDENQYAPDEDRDRPPRVIDRLSYRLDSVGWTIDRPRHVFSIATDGSAERPTELTHGPFSDVAPSVSPDGRTLVFAGARTATWDTDLSTHLYRLALDGDGGDGDGNRDRDGAQATEPEQLTSGTTLHGQPAFSADGRHVSFVWGDRHSMMRHGQVGIIDLDAPDIAGSERLLTTSIGLHCAPYLAAARDPMWVGATSLVFQVDEAGNVPLYRAQLDGSVELLVGGDRQVTGFDAAGGTLAFVASRPTAAADVFVIIDGEERKLTSFADDFAAQHPLAMPQRFTARSKDGTEVEAWVMLPTAGVGEGEQRHPVLFNIHGGPFSQYGNKLFDEFQVQAAAGYAVLYCNPRGSSGYDEPFARAIRGPRAKEDAGSGWGGVDFDDLMAVVDEALRRFDFLDPQRLGVVGGSYGGYMTSWIIGHTDRFKAALSERACNNLLTFAHTSDIGAHFPAGYIGSSHLEDPEEFVRQSPTTYWRDMTTPVLIMHSENDLRCPIEQGEDLYVRLKMSDRDVEFVRFPGESHELSRAGSPRHRVERHELLLDWFARKLR
jgi:dipeptidyl aminopeptidase/acylaminoacyl peptidase